MTFDEILEKLDIKDYGTRIWNSNSHGELSHITDYVVFSEHNETGWFREFFVSAVKMAEESWTRPESVFQHIPEIYNECVKD